MQLLWVAMVPKEFDPGAEAMVQFQQWNNEANYGWPPQNRYGGWNQAVREGSEPAADALEQVWDNIPRDAQILLEGAGWAPRPSPPPGLPRAKGGKGKGKGKDKEANAARQEASKTLWSMANEEQQKLLQAAGVQQPVEEKAVLKELCQKFENSLPPELQEALKALAPNLTPKRNSKKLIWSQEGHHGSQEAYK